MTYKEMGDILHRSQSYLHGIAKGLGLISQKHTPDLEGEVWKEVEGFSSYLISNYGRLKSKQRKIVLKTRVKEGYYDYRLNDSNGEKRSVRIHRLVAENFIPKPNANEPLQVNHIDGNKLNNRVENLEWVTARENQMHAIRTGLKQPSPRPILTESDVREICELIQSGMSYREIEEYNPKYKRSRVEGIRQRIRWKEIVKDYEW